MNTNTEISLNPFPDGWYVLASSSELKPGQILNRKLAGKEVVVFRTTSGKVAVTDAHCPHMGGHFGHGGVVEGESIKCPFHYFCFDTEGNCTATGYKSKPSPKLKLSAWFSEEKNGFILVYYHNQGKSPEWHVPVIESEGWTDVIMADRLLNSHPQEITENSVDIGHFSIVHGYENVAQLKELTMAGHYLNTRYAMTRSGGLFGKFNTLTTEFEVHVLGLGYSFVEVDIPAFKMQTRQFVFATPVDKGQVNLKVGMSIKKSNSLTNLNPLLKLIPLSILSNIVARKAFEAFYSDVAQDFEIWENKIYVTPPVLAKGDGPVMQYRLWASQFYE
jgi:phenylpropionate dioxygenase-like ring-hydroxylating dioxygenase large terminal subunit